MGSEGVPELPGLSCRRHHRPILLLANSPYLARKEGIRRIARSEGIWVKRTLITMDGGECHGNLSGEDEERENVGIRVE